MTKHVVKDRYIIHDNEAYYLCIQWNNLSHFPDIICPLGKIQTERGEASDIGLTTQNFRGIDLTGFKDVFLVAGIDMDPSVKYVGNTFKIIHKNINKI